MKKIASLFSEKALQELKRQLNIILSDEYDYSDNELVSLYEVITDNFQYSYDSDGEPLDNGIIFEEIIDAFVQNNLPH